MNHLTSTSLANRELAGILDSKDRETLGSMELKTIAENLNEQKEKERLGTKLSFEIRIVGLKQIHRATYALHSC